MENSNVKGSGIATILLGAAFVAAAAVGVYQYQNVKETEQEIVALNSQAEELSSSKVVLEDEVESLSEKLRMKIAEAEASAKELEEIKAASKKSKAYSFKAANRRKELEADLVSKNEEIGALQNEITSLQETNMKLEKDLEVVPVLEAEVVDLKGQVSEWEEKYALLEKDFMDLNTRYQKLIYDAPADNFKVEIMTSKGKLTSRARRADQINISFLMPDYLQKEMGENETIYLSLFDEKINPIEGWIEEVSVNTTEGVIPVQVHAVKEIDYSKNPQVVTFTVNTEDKFEQGFYKGKVYTKGDYLGTVDFKLR